MYILFVDLVKAFDQVAREVVVGIPPEVSEPEHFFKELGLNEGQIQFVIDFCASHSSLLEHWGVHPRVVMAIQRLHRGVWFAFEAASSVITTSRGGRQGCKFGSKMFNSPYSVGMALLQQRIPAWP